MYEKQALKCQDDISSYPYVSQEIWANKNDIGEKKFHHIQIPFDTKVCHRFAMDYYIALFFNLDEMFIPREKTLDKTTKRLDWMR